MGRPSRCVAAEESGRRLARAVLESMDPIKLDAVVYPLGQPAALIGALNSPHDKSADKRQSLETKPISRGTIVPSVYLHQRCQGEQHDVKEEGAETYPAYATHSTHWGCSSKTPTPPNVAVTLTAQL